MSTSGSNNSTKEIDVKALLLALLVVLPCAARADMTLVRRGKSPYQIVLPATALPSERYAADELQRYVAQLSGVRLPIVPDSAPVTKREILLGDNTHVRKLAPSLVVTNLG